MAVWAQWSHCRCTSPFGLGLKRAGQSCTRSVKGRVSSVSVKQASSKRQANVKQTSSVGRRAWGSAKQARPQGVWHPRCMAGGLDGRSDVPVPSQSYCPASIGGWAGCMQEATAHNLHDGLHGSTLSRSASPMPQQSMSAPPILLLRRLPPPEPDPLPVNHPRRPLRKLKYCPRPARSTAAPSQPRAPRRSHRACARDGTMFLTAQLHRGLQLSIENRSFA